MLKRTRISRALMLGVAATVLLSSAAAKDLEISNAGEAEDAACYVDAFNADHPDITVNWARAPLAWSP